MLVRIAAGIAVIMVSGLMGSSCTRGPAVARPVQAEMPDDFIGKVRYADANAVRAWQEQGRDLVLLDVRSEEEFAQDGRAPGAVLESYYLGSRRRGENVLFLDRVARKYAGDQLILILCSHGMRATQAAWELEVRKGFTNVFVFPGGYEGHYMDGYGGGDGWKEAGLPFDF